LTVIFKIIINSGQTPTFRNEHQAENDEYQYKMIMEEEENKYNRMDKYELADFLGYDDEDIDDIDEDDIWERTGH
jgi:hypothetical protein